MTTHAKSKRIGLFPASFDPVTNGHLDLIHRSLNVFDEVVVAVATNVAKAGTFTLDERLAMHHGSPNEIDRVRIESGSFGEDPLPQGAAWCRPCSAAASTSSRCSAS